MSDNTKIPHIKSVETRHLEQRDSLFPSLRSTLDSGESNYTSPGLELLGLGTDLDLAPSLRVSAV